MAVTQAMLDGVKSLLGETGAFDATDDVLRGYISAVMDYMRGAGVSASVVEASVGTVARGVDDMWTNNSGASKFSPMFENLVVQLALRSKR